MRVLGIDYGRRRVGVALGDTDARIASPWRVLEHDGDGDVLPQIVEIARVEGASRAVIGVPRPLRDSSMENDQVKEVLAFADQLRAHGLDVETVDETLSSRQAAHVTNEQGRGKRDDVAAAVILQSWLDRSAHSSYGVSS